MEASVKYLRQQLDVKNTITNKTLLCTHLEGALKRMSTIELVAELLNKRALQVSYTYIDITVLIVDCT